MRSQEEVEAVYVQLCENVYFFCLLGSRTFLSIHMWNFSMVLVFVKVSEGISISGSSVLLAVLGTVRKQMLGRRAIDEEGVVIGLEA